MQTFSYTRHDKKETMIAFLTRRFPYQNESNWMRCIAAGEVKVNHQKVSPYQILKSRDVVSYERPRGKEPVVDDTYRILYLDDWILVVEKSGNLPISESGRYYRNTLINILIEREGFHELFAVHRLDKETSGVLLIARTKEVATILGQQFVQQVPEKRYYAVLNGELPTEEVLVTQPIKRISPDQGKVRIRQVVDSSGKPSKTRFLSIKTAGGLTLAEIKTFSGRTHQIRCHAEYIGHPILGDKLYGQPDDFFISLLNREVEPHFPPFGKIERHLLHATSLSFRHPDSNEWLTFESDYVSEFDRFNLPRGLLTGLSMK
ncbi:RluA family pseudouridine synthase [bacterium]|nr:RluA family pseudouridine synthase [bacterium]